MSEPPSAISSNVRTGRLFRDDAYTDERRWVPAEDYERLQAIVERNKASAVHRLHNICDALSEDAKESPFTREEWERIDKQTVEHLHTIQTQGDEIERLRAALAALLTRYVDLVNCGDCGNWDPEKEREVIAARWALSGDSSAPETPRCNCAEGECHGPDVAQAYGHLCKAECPVETTAKSATEAIEQHVRRIEQICDWYNLDPNEWLQDKVTQPSEETSATPHPGACTCPACAPSLWAAGIKGATQPPEKASACPKCEAVRKLGLTSCFEHKQPENGLENEGNK